MYVTFMTKEYRTVSSMLLIFKWRISKECFSNTLMIFTTWPGILRDTVLKITLDPAILASTSAMEELQHAPSSLTFSVLGIKEHDSDGGLSCSGTLGLGTGLGLRLFLRFLDSSDCKTWCNSLMNSITPPIIDAWSPFHIYDIWWLYKIVLESKFKLLYMYIYLHQINKQKQTCTQSPIQRDIWTSHLSF